MKKKGLVFTAIIFPVIFAGFAVAQEKPAERIAPDYTNSQKWNESHEDQRVGYDLNGQGVELLLKHRSFHSVDKAGEHALILHDVRDQPLLMLNIVEGVSASRIDLFKRSGETWSFIKEIKSSQDLEEALKLQFGLTLKRN